MNKQAMKTKKSKAEKQKKYININKEKTKGSSYSNINKKYHINWARVKAKRAMKNTWVISARYTVHISYADRILNVKYNQTKNSNKSLHTHTLTHTLTYLSLYMFASVCAFFFSRHLACLVPDICLYRLTCCILSMRWTMIAKKRNTKIKTLPSWHSWISVMFLRRTRMSFQSCNFVIFSSLFLLVLCRCYCWVAWYKIHCLHLVIHFLNVRSNDALCIKQRCVWLFSFQFLLCLGFSYWLLHKRC